MYKECQAGDIVYNRCKLRNVYISLKGKALLNTNNEKDYRKHCHRIYNKKSFC
jgi:hypothetical protein